MKTLGFVVMMAWLPMAGWADEAPLASGPVAASEVTLAQFQWVNRVIAVFADTPADPNFDRQIKALSDDLEALDERGIVIITDTDPANASSVRLALRPRGFSLVVLDRDGEVKLRKPAPWSQREILAAIDKFPSRRQEMLEQRPSGR